MPTHYTDRDRTLRAIHVAYERAIDAYTVESAVRCHSEILDLLAAEMMLVRTSDQSEAAKDAAINDISICARYHRDVVDRLTDIIEANQQLIWRL